jgi:hypothetical protein
VLFVIDRRAMLGGVLVVGMLAVTGCTSTVNFGITVDGVRKAAVSAGSSPGRCPIPFDLSVALPGGHSVRSGPVDVRVSKTTTPAADPLVAQRDQGMSALDAIAGVSIDCQYQVDDKTFDALFVAVPGHGAIDLMAAQIDRAAHLDVVQVRDFLDHAPQPGEVKLTPGGDIAVARVRVQGDGDASLLVDPAGLVTGDALAKTAGTLAGQI